jgi:hypothetical protein
MIGFVSIKNNLNVLSGKVDSSYSITICFLFVCFLYTDAVGIFLWSVNIDYIDMGVCNTISQNVDERNGSNFFGCGSITISGGTESKRKVGQVGRRSQK